MTPAAALTALLLAVLAWPARHRPSTRLIAATPGARPASVRPTPRRWWWAVAAVPAVAVGGMPLVIAMGVVTGVVVLAARRPRPLPPDPDLPLVVDLLAACLRAGAALPMALRAAAAGSRGHSAKACLHTASALDAGSAPDVAWSPWSRSPEAAAVAQVCLRVSASGAAAADELSRVAARVRARRRAALAQRAQRAGTWVVVPLGLCFLPAFVLVGVVPIGLGLAAHWR